jgi:hypothetical protein
MSVASLLLERPPLQKKLAEEETAERERERGA